MPIESKSDLAIANAELAQQITTLETEVERLRKLFPQTITAAEMKEQPCPFPPEPGYTQTLVAIEALKRIQAKAKQYWNTPVKIPEQELYRVLECIHRDADRALTALRADPTPPIKVELSMNQRTTQIKEALKAVHNWIYQEGVYDIMEESNAGLAVLGKMNDAIEGMEQTITIGTGDNCSVSLGDPNPTHPLNVSPNVLIGNEEYPGPLAEAPNDSLRWLANNRHQFECAGEVAMGFFDAAIANSLHNSPEDSYLDNMAIGNTPAREIVKLEQELTAAEQKFAEYVTGLEKQVLGLQSQLAESQTEANVLAVNLHGAEERCAERDKQLADLEQLLTDQSRQIEGLEAELDSARTWTETMSKEVASARSPDVSALIEAAVKWKERYPEGPGMGWYEAGLDDAVAPFMPAPAPTELELLRKEHEAWDYYVQANNPPSGQMMDRFGNALAAVEAARGGVMPDLKPCLNPRCCKDQGARLDGAASEDWFRVICADCEMQGPESQSPGRAIVFWNDLPRTSPAAILAIAEANELSDAEKELAKYVTGLEVQVLGLQSQLAEKTQQRDSFESSCKELADELTAAQSQLAELELEAARLRADFRDAISLDPDEYARERGRGGRDYAKRVYGRTGLEFKLAELEAENRSLVTGNNELAERAVQWEADIEAQVEEIGRSHVKIEKLTAKLAGQESVSADFADEHKARSLEIADKDARIESLSKSQTELVHSVTARDERIRELEALAGGHVRNHEAALDLLSKSRGKVAELEAERDDFTKRLLVAHKREVDRLRGPEVAALIEAYHEEHLKLFEFRLTGTNFDEVSSAMDAVIRLLPQLPASELDLLREEHEAVEVWTTTTTEDAYGAVTAAHRAVEAAKEKSDE